MAVYSAESGNGAVLKLGGKLFCTAKSCEILTERELHEVYECFSVKPSAIIRGKEKYRAVLESVVFGDFDSDFINSDNISIEVSVGNKKTLLEGCRFSDCGKSISAGGVVEKIEFTALRRTESDEA